MILKPFGVLRTTTMLTLKKTLEVRVFDFIDLYSKSGNLLVGGVELLVCILLHRYYSYVCFFSWVRDHSLLNFHSNEESCVI